MEERERKTYWNAIDTYARRRELPLLRVAIPALSIGSTIGDGQAEGVELPRRVGPMPLMGGAEEV